MTTENKRHPIRSIHVGQTKVLSHGPRSERLLDPYHLVLTLSWPRFFGLLVLLFTALNLIFGAAYWAVPGSVNNARPNVYLDYVFFSIETLATVGYGNMSPANLGGHLIASLEIMMGMVSVALTTGLIFVRFAKPTARILFSQNAVVRNIDGRRMLMLRMANERYNRIVDASAKASVARIETLADGESFYRIHDLKLVRDHTQVFNLTWTLMHEIDESSPLDQLDPDQLAAARMRIVVSVTGHDETVAATVYAVHTYTSTDLAIDARFSDVLSIDAEGGRVVDLTRFHDIEPLSGA